MASETNRIIATRDGSPSLFSERFNQHYHNPNGAVSESIQVFLKPTGLEEKLRYSERLHILEVGFGTGLDLWLTTDLHKKTESKTKIIYQAVEAYPIAARTASKLVYDPFVTPAMDPATIFSSLKPGNNIFQITQHIELHVFYGLFEALIPLESAVDIIFFDAFSPEVNPELWSGDVFLKLKQFSNSSVILATYCAATMARAAMAWAGWYVARVPGALGKREMTLAALDSRLLGNYKRVNETRLKERYQKIHP